jgi:hypothetical protein
VGGARSAVDDAVTCVDSLVKLPDWQRHALDKTLLVGLVLTISNTVSGNFPESLSSVTT